MDEQIEIDKLPSEHKVDAARGVPSEHTPRQEKKITSDEVDEHERLDDRIRKAGI